MTYYSDKNEIVNVVEDYNYDTQCEVYSFNFKKWRQNKVNPYAFNFEMNKKESVFIDGRGFSNRSVSDAENEVLGRIARTVGIAMLIWIFIDNILGKLVILMFDLLGFNIHSPFFSSTIYGGGAEIVTALIITSILKVVIPAVYLQKKLKIPRQVRCMSTLSHPEDMIRALLMALTVSTVICLPNVYNSSTRQIYTYFMNLEADVSVWDQEEFLIFTIFDMIILSVLTEILFRGAIFAALRQFGDWFAIITTASVEALLVMNMTDMPAAFTISVVCGVGMLRSGSIFTSFFVKILYKMYLLAILVIEMSSDMYDDIFLKRNFFMFVVFSISVLIIFAMGLFIEKRQCYAEYHSEVPPKKRIINAAKSYPFPVVVCLCVLAAFLKLVL